MGSPKSGRKYIRTKMKQAKNLTTRILDYLHDLDTYQDGKSPRVSAAIPTLAFIAAQLAEAIDKLYKET